MSRTSAQDKTINARVEEAWMKVREHQPSGSAGRREFQTRFAHVVADQIGTTIDRVRQRIAKIERRETGAPHCVTCTCGDPR